MTVEQCWQSECRLLSIPDTMNTRLAFQAGARHTLRVLTDHLNDPQAAALAGLALNDEIHAFATKAMAGESP